jgi:hypothetical protein
MTHKITIPIIICTYNYPADLTCYEALEEVISRSFGNVEGRARRSVRRGQVPGDASPFELGFASAIRTLI